MIIAFDNTFLSLALNPSSKPRPNPSTGQPIEHCVQRVEALLDRHSKHGDTILIPAPCLAELLCAVPDLEKALGEINGTVAFDVAPFNARCAIELAKVTREALSTGDKRSGVSADWQEVKFDRQIAVIAKIGGAECFYTDDVNQAAFARKMGLVVKHTWELDLPPDKAQRALDL
jgi:hypothetical protein